jgi:hypothetical protein
MSIRRPLLVISLFLLPLTTARAQIPFLDALIGNVKEVNFASGALSLGVQITIK